MASANVRNGPLLVWNGQTSIAKIINEAGIGDKNSGLEKMFDGNHNTHWHSCPGFIDKPKSIKIEFTNPINFVMLKIRKRMDPNCTKRYFNVCLVLDGQIDDQMCTNTPDGFNNDISPLITWYKPTNKVTTVELIWRETTGESAYAQIADLEIFHQPL